MIEAPRWLRGLGLWVPPGPSGPAGPAGPCGPFHGRHR